MSLTHHLKRMLIDNVEAVDDLLFDERKTFFNTPKIKTYYDLLSSYQPKTKEAQLTYMWLALLSGDNRTLYTMGQRFDVSNLPTTSQAFFYDLRALSSVFNEDNARLTNAKKALDLLENDSSFYKANAYLTYAQVLAGNNKLRNAADMFINAYKLFIDTNLVFPATVSLTNALLNYSRLGEFDEVIKHVRQFRIISSSFQVESNPYTNLVLLPLGMTYLEQGNTDLAKVNLLKANKVIHDANLIHMHGYIEIYLLKLYHITNDKVHFDDVMNDATTMFKTMHYPMMQIIIHYGKLLRKTLSKEDIVTIEAAFLEGSIAHPVVIEILLALLRDDKLTTITLDTLIKPIDTMRYMGDRISLMQSLCYIADYYTKHTYKNEANLIIEEIIDLYHTHAIQAPLLLHTYSFSSHLKKMDTSIRVKKPKTLLTEKEKEILELINTGSTNQTIANTLYITVGTVKWHINNILSKLHAKNRHDAVQKARANRIL